MYYIYLIRCSDDSLYTGITTDLKRRMNEHYYKKKAAANYTKAHDVISIERVWACENRSLASKLESRIKKLSKSNKELLISTPSQFEGYELIQHQSLEYYVNKRGCNE